MVVTREKVNRLLKEYRVQLGRCKYLERLIPLLEAEVETMKRSLAEESISIRGAALDGLPHGNDPSDPTQTIGLLLASGYQPDYLKKKEEELRLAQVEYRKRSPNVIFVEAWLKGLSPREKWVVENHIIDSLTWNEMIKDYERTFGETRTKRCLQQIKKQALEKIYSFAL